MEEEKTVTALELLLEEIGLEIENLHCLGLGSKEHSMATDDVAKLYRLAIEETKHYADSGDRADRLKAETEQFEKELALKEEQVQRELDTQRYEKMERQIQAVEQKKERYFNLGIRSAEIVLPLIFYGIWMRRGLKFEETGTFTSATFKGLFNRFRTTK